MQLLSRVTDTTFKLALEFLEGGPRQQQEHVLEQRPMGYNCSVTVLERIKVLVFPLNLSIFYLFRFPRPVSLLRQLKQLPLLPSH